LRNTLTSIVATATHAPSTLKCAVSDALLKW
jgi:hypothetical protein